MRQSVKTTISSPLIFALAAFYLLASGIIAAAEKSDLALRRRYQAQQQARAMTTELVSSILDIQLRQFKENKLDKLPAYSDIETMKQNLDRLVDCEMQSVVELLAKAEGATDAERQTAMAEARTKGRAVVVALLAEQQRLRQRMRLAKIAAQARQLIDLETAIVGATQQLSEKPPAERERSTLEQIENQRDISVLNNQLLITLRELSKWEGTIATTASKGLDLLNKRQIEQELKNIDVALNGNQFAAAEKAESAAIKAWNELLEMVEEAQGLIDGNRDALSQAVDDLREKQAQLRDETKESKLDDPSQSEQLAEKQHAVHDELNELMEKLPQNPSSDPLAKQAADAAYEAEANLFEGKQQPALQQQEKVIESLSELSKQMRQFAQANPKPSSDELAKNQSSEKSTQPADAAQGRQLDSNDKLANDAMRDAKKTNQTAAQQQPGDAIEQSSEKVGNPAKGQQSGSTPGGNSAISPPQRSVEVEPWFAKLPPDVQKAIQARSRRSAPRGYEERMKRYFEAD